MAKKNQRTKNQSPSSSSTTRKKVLYDYEAFKLKHANKLLFTGIALVLLFLISIFKNISYPLFWADESMTAIGTERVIQYGYPKVHDGKNVFYDLRHTNPSLGINVKDDAYVGGTGWAHYYYGVIGYKLAGLSDDLFQKTGIYRTTYAIAGLIGLFLLGFFISKFFPDKFWCYAFLSLFVLFELMSVSLALSLREVRYYSLVFLLSSIILGSYSLYRFYRPFNKLLLICTLTIALWVLFTTFAPVYFIMIGTIGLTELIIGIDRFRKSNFSSTLKYILPVAISLFLSLAGVFPLLSYFKTFEISKAMNEFNGYNNEMYWNNISTIFKYFKNFEFLWLALGLKTLILLDVKTYLKEKNSLFRVSSFFALYFIIYFFMIARIPNFIYTRYIIYLQPILVITIILDFFLVLQQLSRNSTNLVSPKMTGTLLIFTLLFAFSFITNFKNIEDHAYELTHQYKGPLDYTIPYLKEKYPDSEKLVIAANYEETSYMYYLNSKVIIGFTGNNLSKDAQIGPDVIAYRKTWGNYQDIFNQFLSATPYEAIKFPVKDSPVNNIPELNFMPAFNHQFKTIMAGNDQDVTYLYIRK